MAIFHDTEFREQEVDAETGVCLKQALQVPEPLRCYALPSATVASIVHHGAFSHIAAAYGALLRWIEASGYRPSGPTREIFLSVASPVSREDESNVTEIQVPVARVELDTRPAGVRRICNLHPPSRRAARLGNASVPHHLSSGCGRQWVFASCSGHRVCTGRHYGVGDRRRCRRNHPCRTGLSGQSQLSPRRPQRQPVCSCARYRNSYGNPTSCKSSDARSALYS